MRHALAFVLATGCAASSHPKPDPIHNDGGDHDAPATRADGSLAGPFARVLDAPDFADTGDPENPPEVKVLGSAEGAIDVSLREVRGSWTAATCAVVLAAPGGLFVGNDFLCSADRSDETVVTDEVSVSIEGDAAVVRFRVSYQIDRGAPDVQRHEIRCHLTGTLSCTPPPAVGGYE